LKKAGSSISIGYMTKRIIGFDLDGTILSNFKVKLRIAKKMGLDLAPEQTPSELIKEFFAPELYHKFQRTIYDSKEALAPVLMKGVYDILSDLKKKKIEFYLISRRKGPEMAVKIMKKHKIWPNFFNEKNSFFVLHPEDKEVRAAKLGITDYIDDEKRVLRVLSSVPNKYLFDQFDIYEKSDHYIKIGSWLEFKKHLKI